ncbi:MAG: SDR family oxidoreductase, partial [Halioglobus sp.]|nr:SDR family oxidoreductase [Halioglobus sp.]
MQRVEGKVAVVTGGGAGIGKAVAELLSREGASVTVADFDEAAGMKVVLGINRSGGNAIFVKTDVGIKSDVVRMVEETAAAFGAVNILINNAWAGSDLLRFEWEADAWMQRAYEMGALGPYWAMQAAFPYMKKQAWGRVVNLCSLNGVNAHMYMVAYNSAK